MIRERYDARDKNTEIRVVDGDPVDVEKRYRVMIVDANIYARGKDILGM